jgi:hypothetical protein
MKTKVHIIGNGKWGNILKKNIENLVEFVKPNEADWIIISTPNDLHYEQTKYWLTQGKNVFCEKPLTLSYESAVELFEIADTFQTKLFVDDVFCWRDDYVIYDDVNHFVWTKPNQKDYNYLDRLAYHHFYMWVQDSDFEVESIEGHLDDFKIRLEDGRVAEFKYGYSSEPLHFVNETDLVNFGGSPLEIMFEFLFDNKVDYNFNRKVSLNAIRLSQKVRETISPKALVVGGGVFGLTSAIELSNNGYLVDVKEKSDSIMSGASSINQYRLHKGYHYPRSKETAQECLDGLYSFKRKYEDCIVNGGITHMYSIASDDSMVSGEEYKKFLDDMNLSYYEREPMPNCDLTIVADEELFCPKKLSDSLQKKVWSSHINIETNTEVKSLDKLKEKYDIVVVATYSNINQLLDKKREYQFEVCEKPVVRLPKIFEDISIVIMDGPFMCLDPYENENHVLGNVVHAIHETNIGENPKVSDELKSYLNKGVIKNPKITNIDKFIDSGIKYFGDEFGDLEHIGSMYTIRAVLKDRDHDDARPTLVNHEGDNIYTLFSGKIDTCVNAGRELIRIVDGKN